MKSYQSRPVGRPAAADPVAAITLALPRSRLAQLERLYADALAQRRTSAKSLNLFIRDLLGWHLDDLVARGAAPPVAAVYHAPPPRQDAPAMPGSAADHAWVAQGASTPFSGHPSAPQGPARSTAHIPPIVIAPGDRSFLPPPAAPGSIESVISPAVVEAFFNPRPGTNPDDSIEDMLPPSLRKPRQATPALLESPEGSPDVGDDHPKLPGHS